MCLSVVWSDLPCLDCHAHRLSVVTQIDISQDEELHK
jgi:hypothetical protein